MFATLRVIIFMSVTGIGLLVAAFYVGRGDLSGESLAWIISLGVVVLGGISQFAHVGMSLLGLARFLRLVAFVLVIVAFVLAWKLGLAAFLGGLGGAVIGAGFAELVLHKRLASLGKS